MPRKLIQIYPLKGMDQSLHSAIGTASKVENMRWDRRGLWRKSHGYNLLVQVKEQDGATKAPVSGLFWYDTDFGGRRWLVWEQKQSATTSKIVYYDFNGGAARTIDGGRYWTDTPWIGTQYLNIGDDLYMVNGQNPPKRWDTVKAVQAGFSSRPAPPLIDDRNITKDLEFSAGTVTFTVPAPAAYEMYYDRSYTPVLGGGSGGYYRSAGGKNQRGVGEAYPLGDRDAVIGDPVAKYGYAITYLNELGMESPLSELRFGSARTFHDTGKRCIALHIDNPPTHVTAVRIYRTKNLTPSDYKSNGEGELIRFPLVNFSLDLRETDNKLFAQEQEVYLLEELPACAQTFADTKSDADLGLRYDFEATGVWPRGASLLAWHHARLWAAGTSAHPDRVYYSHEVYREQWPELNYLTFPDRVTALHDAGEVLYVFTASSCHVVWEDESRRPRMQTISDSVGTVAPNAIKPVPGVGVCFVSSSGIWALQGKDGIKLLSGPLQKLWEERIFAGSLRQAHAWVDAKEREVWFHVPADGTFTASLGLVLHFETGFWSIRTNYPAARFVQTTDGSHRTYMASHQTSTQYNGIFLYGPAYHQQADSNFRGTWTSNWINLGDVHESDRYLQLQVAALGYGERSDHKLTLAWYANRSRINESDVPAMSPLHVENETEYLLWGDTTWGDGVTEGDLWKEYEHVLVRQDLIDRYGNPGVTAREFKFAVSSAKLALSGVGLEVERPTRKVPVETQNQNVEAGT